MGSRGSKLALWQTDHVLERLQKAGCKQVEFQKVIIKTKGDKLLDVALSKIGDKGLFTKEIEHELLEGRIDMAVHSMKDLATAIPEGLMIGATLSRENPRDVLISREGLTLAELPPGSRVGTSSLRRRAQLKMIRPDLEVVELRGNVETRISKLQGNEGLSAIILARAGVERMGFSELITEELDFLPAVGQGVICVEVRCGDDEVLECLQHINDPLTFRAVQAERAFLKALEGGCQVPMGALGRVEGNRLFLEGLVSSLDGSRFVRDALEGDLDSPQELGRALAERLLAMGAGDILNDIRKQQ